MKYKNIKITAYVLAAAVTFSGMSLTVDAAGSASVLPSGGIGLSIAKAIVTAHGGKIRAVVADGTGLQITTQFPQQN